MDKPLTKQELRRQIERFMADHNRGISLYNFATIAGYSEDHFLNVFKYKKFNLTEEMQIRVSRALAAWKRGEIRVMVKPFNHEKYAEYRPRGEVRPRISRRVSFDIKDGAIRLKPGLVNRMDYSQPGLDELIGD